MQKKNALGTDPLSWLKGKDQEENVDNQEKQTDNPAEMKNVGDQEPIIRHRESAIMKMQEEKVYEHGNVTETHNIQEEPAYEPRGSKETHRKSILGENAYAYHAKSHETTQKESPATAFVIAYTILLLILGFIVYRDITKQIDSLNTKLENIEKQIVDTGIINREHIKDIW